MSMATMANWGANFVVTMSLLTRLNAINDSATFFLFTTLTLVALLYFIKRVPETKGLSLQEIERQLARPSKPASDPPESCDAPAVQCSIRGGETTNRRYHPDTATRHRRERSST
jgi:hypothetical protein